MEYSVAHLVLPHLLSPYRSAVYTTLRLVCRLFASFACQHTKRVFVNKHPALWLVSDLPPNLTSLTFTNVPKVLSLTALPPSIIALSFLGNKEKILTIDALPPSLTHLRVGRNISLRFDTAMLPSSLLTLFIYGKMTPPSNADWQRVGNLNHLLMNCSYQLADEKVILPKSLMTLNTRKFSLPLPPALKTLLCLYPPRGFSAADLPRTLRKFYATHTQEYVMPVESLPPSLQVLCCLGAVCSADLTVTLPSTLQQLGFSRTKSAGILRYPPSLAKLSYFLHLGMKIPGVLDSLVLANKEQNGPFATELEVVRYLEEGLVPAHTALDQQGATIVLAHWLARLPETLQCLNLPNGPPITLVQHVEWPLRLRDLHLHTTCPPPIRCFSPHLRTLSLGKLYRAPLDLTLLPPTLAELSTQGDIFPVRQLSSLFPDLRSLTCVNKRPICAQDLPRLLGTLSVEELSMNNGCELPRLLEQLTYSPKTANFQRCVGSFPATLNMLNITADDPYFRNYTLYAHLPFATCFAGKILVLTSNRQIASCLGPAPEQRARLENFRTQISNIRWSGAGLRHFTAWQSPIALDFAAPIILEYELALLQRWYWTV